MPTNEPSVSRRSLLTTVGLSSLAGCSTFLSGSPDEQATESPATTPTTTEGNSDPSGWSQVGRTAAHAGYNPTVSGESEPTLAWEKEVEGSLTTPTVTDGTIYVTRGVPTRDGTQATIEAYAVDSGDRLWDLPLDTEFEYNAPLSNHRPIVHGRRIYAVSDDGLVAADRDTQEFAWKKTVDAFLNDPPTVTDDGLFVTGRDAFVHIDHDGNERWRIAADAHPRPRLAAVADDVAYVPVGGSLLAIDVATGDVRWEYNPDDGSVDDMVVVHDGTIVYTSFGGFGAVSTDGTSQWSVPGFDREDTLRAVVGDGSAFVAGIEGSVAGFDLASGEKLWQESLGDGEWTQETTPVLVDGALCVPQSNGKEASVHGLDPSSGQERWRISTTDARIRGPIPAGEYLVTTTQDRHVNAEPNPNATGESPEITGTIWVYATGE